MKFTKAILTAIIMVSSLAVFAQQGQYFKKGSVIRPYHIDISWHKTTLLIFPAPIQTADRGGSYVLAEKVKGAGNVLKVKAGQKDFEQSNLSVITQDGKVYSFLVNYCEDPEQQTIDLRNEPPDAPVQFAGSSLNSQQIAGIASLIPYKKAFIRGVKQKKHQMSLKLQRIFIKDDVLFVSYAVKNNSQIRYDPAFLRFYVSDKKLTKRTAVRETEVFPLYLQELPSVEGGKEHTIVAAFEKFTIADDKVFITELMEGGGDRNLHCRLKQHKMLKARVLP